MNADAVLLVLLCTAAFLAVVLLLSIDPVRDDARTLTFASKASVGPPADVLLGIVSDSPADSSRQRPSSTTPETVPLSP